MQIGYNYIWMQCTDLNKSIVSYNLPKYRSTPNQRTGEVSNRSATSLGTVFVVVTALLGCGDGGGPDVLAINDGDGTGFARAGEHFPEPGEMLTFGMGMVENVGTEEITLVGIRPELFGDIELQEAIVSGADREAVHLTSDNVFPPDVDLGTIDEVAGHVVEPSAGREGFSSDNVVLGFVVGRGSEIAGMTSYCIDYRIGEQTTVRSRCWKTQHFIVCDDFDAPTCDIP